MDAGHQPLELLAAVLAVAIGVVQQLIGFPVPLRGVSPASARGIFATLGL
jgi:hypothetical protein